MPTILITAGEPSGDRLGGALMAALKKRRPNLRFIGVGGPEMLREGLSPVFPMSEIAVMGLAEVVPAIPRILRRLSQLARVAEAELPMLAITIDAQDFSSRLAKKLKHLRIPHVHYVAPKVWAWRQHRVHGLKNLYTHLLTILPFETDFFANAGIPATYVGHPATTALAPFRQPVNKPAPPEGTGSIREPVPSKSRESVNPSIREPVLALLPGSRKTELTRHWALMLATFRELRQKTPQLRAILALPDEAALARCRELAPWTENDPIQPVFGEARFPELANCTAALAKSGTVTLELALLGVPSVVCYRMNGLTYLLAKHLVKVPAISLPNLILGGAEALQPDAPKPKNGQFPVYPELLQSAATPQTLAEALTPLLAQTPARNHQLTMLSHLQTLLKTPQPPAEMAAEAILPYLPHIH